jgi:outer membrane protein
MYRYLFALDINKEFISKEERIRATLAAKRKKLEEDISNFEYKCNAKTFTSEDEFINEREDIMKKEQEYIQQRDELYRALESENVAKGEELHDSINSFIKEYNKVMGYDFILTKIGDNIIYANEAFDITNDVIKELNKRYNK